jgi:serine/threonine-protein kinase
MTLGTPAYMSPELLAGAPASPASDAYALGVMLFELLCGRRPHRAATLGELLHATAHESPASLGQLRPDLPAPAAAAIEQLLANAPAARPADLAQWSAHLASLAALMTRVLAPAADTPL